MVRRPSGVVIRRHHPHFQTCISLRPVGQSWSKFIWIITRVEKRLHRVLTLWIVSKFNVGLKTLLHQGLSEPEFYGDWVYKFKQIVGRADFSDQFRKIIVRYKLIGYNVNIMRQSACLVFNPVTVNNFASLFNCTPVSRASDSMMAPT